MEGFFFNDKVGCVHMGREVKTVSSKGILEKLNVQAALCRTSSLFSRHSFHCGICETCQPGEWQFSNKKAILLIGR